jgi:hypothetical protein
MKIETRVPLAWNRSTRGHRNANSAVGWPASTSVQP